MSALSPSLNHQYLLKKIQHSHAYRGEDVKPWQGKLRRKLKSIVGDMPEKRCALKPRSLWKRKHALGEIEKIVFTSEPHSDVNAFVCIPKSVNPPYRWVICLQGHSTGAHNSIAVDRENNRKNIKVEGDRDFGLIAMRYGFAALCIEQRSFGERRELKQKRIADHGCHDASMHALMLGRTLVGERVYDVDRGIDYLATRNDVDMKSIGVMGNSGGGTISIYASALLPRLAFSMPSCAFCTYADSIMSIYHCMDNYLPGLLKVADSPDIVGLFAPKPMVIVNGQTDSIFPIAPAKKAFAKVKKIYKAAGAADKCHFVIGNGGHRFYADDAWPVLIKLLDKN